MSKDVVVPMSVEAARVALRSMRLEAARGGAGFSYMAGLVKRLEAGIAEAERPNVHVRVLSETADGEKEE